MTTAFGVSSFVRFRFRRERERERDRDREKKERHPPSRMAGGDDVEPIIIIIIIIIQNEHRPSSFVPLARRPRATTTPRGRPILLSRRSWSFEILVSKISTSAVAFGHVGVPQALFLLCLLDDTRAQRRKKRRKQERVHFCASIGKTVTSRRKKK